MTRMVTLRRACLARPGSLPHTVMRAEVVLALVAWRKKVRFQLLPEYRTRLLSHVMEVSHEH
jgi:hypothetical protein